MGFKPTPTSRGPQPTSRRGTENRGARVREPVGAGFKPARVQEPVGGGFQTRQLISAQHLLEQG